MNERRTRTAERNSTTASKPAPKSWALEQPNCKSGLLCARTTYIFQKYHSCTPQWPHGPYIAVGGKQPPRKDKLHIKWQDDRSPYVRKTSKMQTYSY